MLNKATVRLRSRLGIDENGNSYNWGRGTICVILFSMMIVSGCTKRDADGSVAIKERTTTFDNPYMCVVDSCEYLKWGHGVTHKGNCKFCKERKEKEIEKLKEELKRELNNY